MSTTETRDRERLEGAEVDADGKTLPFDEDAAPRERFTSVGEELRRERELRDITLQEISEETKISVRNLKGIEENDFDRLPGGIYTKNFIRAYCRYLGINEEKMVNHYLYQTSPRKEPKRGQDGSKERKSSFADLPVTALYAAGAVVLIVVIALVWMVASRPDWWGGAEEPGREMAAEGGPQAAAAAIQPLRFQFRARGDSWVSLEVDGKPRMNRILKKGEYFSITARRGIVLAVQDAGAIEWSINGAPALPLGGDGEVVEDLSVSQGNWRTWVESETAAEQP